MRHVLRACEGFLIICNCKSQFSSRAVKYSLTIIGCYSSSIHKHGPRSTQNAAKRPHSWRQSVKKAAKRQKQRFPPYNGKRFSGVLLLLLLPPPTPGFSNVEGPRLLQFAKPNIIHCLVVRHVNLLLASLARVSSAARARCDLSISSMKVTTINHSTGLVSGAVSKSISISRSPVID